MKQKSRLLFVASWLVLRLHWSLALLHSSVAHAWLKRSWTKPGVILFSRQPQRYPTDRWHFDGRRSVYLYSDHSTSALHICFLPEYSAN
jgi:hypothetical protein